MQNYYWPVSQIKTLLYVKLKLNLMKEVMRCRFIALSNMNISMNWSLDAKDGLKGLYLKSGDEIYRSVQQIKAEVWKYNRVNTVFFPVMTQEDANEYNISEEQARCL